MTDARLMMIRHWHLRNGHPPSDGKDYCDGCAHEMDDLIKHMDAAGLAIVPKEPTEMMVCKGDDVIVTTLNEMKPFQENWDTPALACWRAMVGAASDE